MIWDGGKSKRGKGAAPKANRRTAQRDCTESSDGSVGKNEKATTGLVVIIWFSYSRTGILLLSEHGYKMACVGCPGLFHTIEIT
jgi:hypothetical protein